MTWLDETGVAVASAMGEPNAEKDPLARMHAWTLANIVLSSEITGDSLQGDLHAFVEPRFDR